MSFFFYGGLVYIDRIPALLAGESGAVPLSSTKIMEQWQMWSLRRTENPQELDRNQPAPHMVAVVQLVRTLDCGSGGHGFEARSSP